MPVSLDPGNDYDTSIFFLFCERNIQFIDFFLSFLSNRKREKINEKYHNLYDSNSSRFNRILSGSKPVRKREIQLRIILYSIEENTNSSSCSVRVASKGLVIFGRPRYALGRVQRVPMGRRGDLSDLVFTSLSLSLAAREDVT